MIIWGTKPVYRKLGYVYDFCPICRQPRSFILERLGMAGHIYYISLADGELVGYQRTCMNCKTFYSSDPSIYKAFSKNNIDPIAKLKSDTFPNFSDFRSERLRLEAIISDSIAKLTEEERKELISEPFFLISPKVEKRFARTYFDKEVSLSMFFFIVLWLFMPSIADALMLDNIEIPLLTSMVIGICFITWQYLISGRRYMRREILPILVTTLTPLNPKKEEIDSVLSNLNRLGYKIAKKLKLTDFNLTP